jgi:hypothetical protein
MITKRMFLIFPPGCGGNHLANMLSFDENVEDRTTDYKALKEHYKKVHPGHTKHPNTEYFVGHQNLRNLNIDLINNATKTMILCGHASELGHQLFSNSIPADLLEDSVFVLFTYPKEGSLVDKKMKEGPWYNGEQPKTHSIEINDIKCEIETAYNQHNFIQEWSSPQKPELDPFTVFEFNTEIFHGSSGFDYAEQYFNDLFGITLTKEARELHDITYKNWTA